jgi:hypothetical protein
LAGGLHGYVQILLLIIDNVMNDVYCSRRLSNPFMRRQRLCTLIATSLIANIAGGARQLLIASSGAIVVIVLAVTILSGCASVGTQLTPTSGSQAGRAQFLVVADMISNELEKPFREYEIGTLGTDRHPSEHHLPFFEDAYGVLALCVTYDKTHVNRYLDSSKEWADQMIVYQQDMNPAGAYYMNYYRKPRQSHGDWYVADANSIAIGVLAVGTRTRDPKYLDSVLAYQQMIQRFVASDGGVSDGLWGNYTAAWWASTATYGSLQLALYDYTRDPVYLQGAAKALNWISKTGINNFAYPNLKQDGPAIMFYTGWFLAEARLAGLRADTTMISQWFSENQKSLNPHSKMNYFNETYMAGMPAIQFRMGQEDHAESELVYIASILPNGGFDAATWSFITWTAASQAAQIVYGTEVLTTQPASPF